MHVPRDCKLKVVGENNADRLMWSCSRLAKDRGDYLSLVAARENENDPNHKRTVLACRYVVFLASYRRMGYNKPKRKQEALRFLETWHPERGAYSEELAIQRRIAGISFSNGDSEDVRNAAIHLGDWAADILRKHEAEVAAAVAHDAAQHAEAVARRAVQLQYGFGGLPSSTPTARLRPAAVKLPSARPPQPSGRPCCGRGQPVAKQPAVSRAVASRSAHAQARYDGGAAAVGDAKARVDRPSSGECRGARRFFGDIAARFINAQLQEAARRGLERGVGVQRRQGNRALDRSLREQVLIFAGMPLGRWVQSTPSRRARRPAPPSASARARPSTPRCR